MMKERKSGVLLHISSLPGSEGIGTTGKEAYRFIDFLRDTGQKYWQILPLGPVGAGNSPYQCFSAFAGDPMYIDLENLVYEGLLDSDDLSELPRFRKKKVQYKQVRAFKYDKLQKAFKKFSKNALAGFDLEYYRFLDEHAWWLNDYALFMSAREEFGTKSWHDWDRKFKHRHEKALSNTGEKLAVEVDFHKFLQFFFFRQWFQLKSYANECGVGIIGDLPLYVSGESSDVWANTDIFLLDEDLQPTEVGGVPPDYFSETGQLWGNPVFNWPRLKEREYDWWMARLHFNLNMFNRVRIDHFRGLESYWSIPAGEKTAINGRWVPAHGYEMLDLLRSQIGDLPFIAEDLGIITPEVDRLRENFKLPGMKVLQFAFTTDASHEALPHNHERNCVVYTGTHDNDTTLGWLRTLAGEERAMVQRYIGDEIREIPLSVMEMALSSVAELSIIPMQDILYLDSKSRMNIPGTAEDNWEWRFSWSQLRQNQRNVLRELTEKYNR